MLIRYLWDFRGKNAEKTAEHHAVHLNDFLQKHAIGLSAEFELEAEGQAIAWIDLDQLPTPLLETLPASVVARSQKSSLGVEVADRVAQSLRPNRYELLGMAKESNSPF
ncbi:MAG: hypothetical protein MK135_04815 [Polyangiaceae bacterium]|nr:hypothetical protein [Polyangiaceae bacterium]